MTMNEPLNITCECCGHERHTQRYFLVKMLGIELRFYFRIGDVDNKNWNKEYTRMVRVHKLNHEEQMLVLKEGIQ